MNVMRTLPRLLSDTGQKKTPEKKDGRRMSFQRPKGTTEYSVSNAQVTLGCVNNVLFVPVCVSAAGSPAALSVFLAVAVVCFENTVWPCLVAH